MIIEIIIILITTVVIYLYYSHRTTVNSIREQGVAILPGVPFFGNFLKSTFMRRHLFYDIQEVYKAFPNERYVCVLEGTDPVIMIKDPELIKQITIKDFDHFTDHRQYFDESQDPLFGGSLVMLKGDKWRDMRSVLSPAFTGSKMKRMVPFMNTISENIVKHLTTLTNVNNDKISEEIDIDDLMRRYTNDVIASTAFGLEVDSVKDKLNEFYMTGKKLAEFTIMQKINMFVIAVFPGLAKKLNMQLYPQEISDFFTNLVKNTMAYREKNNVYRPDMIQLLMEAAKGTLKSQEKADDNLGFAHTEESTWHDHNSTRRWTQEELTSQAFIFFFGGFEPIASVLVMTIHELVLNPEIQDKLHEELKRFSETHEILTYESIPELKYLDMVLNETFRKWSPSMAMDRECLKPYELPPPKPGYKPYKLEKGDIVYNVINCIHMDDKYYPNPERFDPERFSDENKNKIKPYTFMPFGVGPRNCIATRFALLKLKVILYHLLLNFKMLKCAKTSDPLRLRPADFNFKAVGGTWVKMQARN